MLTRKPFLNLTKVSKTFYLLDIKGQGKINLIIFPTSLELLVAYCFQQEIEHYPQL